MKFGQRSGSKEKVNKACRNKGENEYKSTSKNKSKNKSKKRTELHNVDGEFFPLVLDSISFVHSLKKNDMEQAKVSSLLTTFTMLKLFGK